MVVMSLKKDDAGRCRRCLRSSYKVHSMLGTRAQTIYKRRQQLQLGTLDLKLSLTDSAADQGAALIDIAIHQGLQSKHAAFFSRSDLCSSES